jgi:hypothetical protein
VIGELSKPPKRLAASVLALGLAGALAGLAVAGLGRWGPPGGPEDRSIAAVVVDPRDPQIVYAASSGGVLRSTDGGASWRLAMLEGRAVAALAIDPQNPQTVYAGTYDGAAVFQSMDSGRSWHQIMSGGGDKTTEIRALAVDPQNPQTIHAAQLGFGILRASYGR